MSVRTATRNMALGLIETRLQDCAAHEQKQPPQDWRWTERIYTTSGASKPPPGSYAHSGLQIHRVLQASALVHYSGLRTHGWLTYAFGDVISLYSCALFRFSRPWFGNLHRNQIVIFHVVV